MSYYTDEVDKAVRVLDVERPGWQDLVDPNALNLKNCKECILGHIYGDFCDAPDDLINMPAFCGNVVKIVSGAGDTFLEFEKAWKEYLTCV